MNKTTKLLLGMNLLITVRESAQKRLFKKREIYLKEQTKGISKARGILF